MTSPSAPRSEGGPAEPAAAPTGLVRSPARAGGPSGPGWLLVLASPLGEVEVQLLAGAPRTVAHVLALVEADGFAGSTFYRVQRQEHWVPGREFTGVQGGPQRTDLPTVEHEPGAAAHGLGTVSLARLGPGTARAELFVCLDEAAPALDPGAAAPMDGFGFAVFGQVVGGLPVLLDLHGRPTLDDAPHPLVRGQLLAEPVPFSVLLRRRSGRGTSSSPPPLDRAHHIAR